MCCVCMCVCVCVLPHPQSECSVGSHTSCMVVSQDDQLMVATGGRENDLKLWDGTTAVFQAKNVRTFMSMKSDH